MEKFVLKSFEIRKMELYVDYAHFSESTLLDNFVYEHLIINKFMLSCLFFFNGPIAFTVAMNILWLRKTIFNVHYRRFLGWVFIAYCFYYKIYMWTVIFLGIEIGREFTRYLVPYFISICHNVIPDDPVQQTTIRRLIKIIKFINQQSLGLTTQQLLLISTTYCQKDGSEAFDEDEKNKLKNVFIDFDKSSFIYEKDTSNLTIFFPSFIIRFTNSGIQLTSNNVKLIRGDDEKCPICLEKYSDFCIKLECEHIFCHKCIFSWLNQQYNCPICRKIVS